MASVLLKKEKTYDSDWYLKCKKIDFYLIYIIHILFLLILTAVNSIHIFRKICEKKWTLFSFFFQRKIISRLFFHLFFKKLILWDHISVSFEYGLIVSLSIFDLYWKSRACQSYSRECSELFLSFKGLSLIKLDIVCTWWLLSLFLLLFYIYFVYSM